MLYGGVDIDNKITEWLKKKSNDCGMASRLIYATCANSFPQGISRYDSDYDLHVLRYKFDRALCIDGPILRTEINRRYSDIIDIGAHPRAHIELIEWNDVDLFSALVCPEEEQRRISSTVYYILYSTLYTQYAYDPLGIIPPILSVCAPICDINMILEYFWKRANSRTVKDIPVSLKNFMSRLHCYLSIIWIGKYRGFPPLDIKSLMKQIDDRKTVNMVYGFFEDNRYEVCDAVDKNLLEILDGYKDKAMSVYGRLKGEMPVASKEDQVRAYRQVVAMIDVITKDYYQNE